MSMINASFPGQVITQVTASLRPRQTLLFSATMPANLDRLARSAVLDPVSQVLKPDRLVLRECNHCGNTSEHGEGVREAEWSNQPFESVHTSIWGKCNCIVTFFNCTVKYRQSAPTCVTIPLNFYV